LKNLSAWREYGRKFITIGGWLLKKKKITDEEYATYYWNGIPRALRSKLENRLLATDPTRSLANPFAVDQINSAAEALLQRDRFDANFAGSDEEEDSDDEIDEEDETSDSDDEDELKRIEQRLRKRARFTKRISSASDTDEDNTRTPKQRTVKEIKRKINGKQEPEIETLIKQINTMSLDDPGYAGMVFRALKIDPDVMKVIRPPVFVTRPKIPDAPKFPIMTQPFQPQLPPHMAPGFVAPRSYGMSQPVSECYGCGGQGHRMATCPDIQEFIAKNMIARNETGRYVYSDGAPIRRAPGESIASAVRREKFSKTQEQLESHLIRVVGLSDQELTENTYYCELESEASETEESDRDCDNLISAAVLGDWHNHEEAGLTYPVTRTNRTMSAKRKEAMEGEYLPPKRRKQAVKPKENDKAQRDDQQNSMKDGEDRDRPIKPLPSTARLQVPVPIASKTQGEKDRNRRSGEPKEPVPVQVRVPEYNGRRDDEIIEDVTMRPPHGKKPDSTGKERPKEEAPDRKDQIMDKRLPGTRQSEVAAQIKPGNVLSQLLNTRIELGIGEVLGISKDLSALLSDKIKPKTTKASVPIAASLPIATSFYTKNRGLLIQLHMQCDGRPITAIIDTGSQLNIVNKNICDTKIRRPVDNQEKISIADANGGQGKLEGMVANVPLNCGDVSTRANLYVGTHVPFELLLGRPWQRGNYVTIDERRNGTYLLFKDPKNLEPRFEILVGQERAAEVEYELPVWNVPEPEGSISYLTMIGQAPEEAGSAIKKPKHALPFLEKTMIDHTGAPHHELEDDSTLLTTSANTAPTGTSLMLSRAPVHGKYHWRRKGIKERTRFEQKLPESNCIASKIMSSGLATNLEIQPNPIIPLNSQALLRLDSEITVAALADAPFLKRSNNLHPLILSTSDGVLLGKAVDASGYTHFDYVFLHAGLFNLANSPFTVTPASAFVRVFPELSGGPPQPWILPCINEPPSTVAVSRSNLTKETHKTDLQTDLKYERGNKQAVMPSNLSLTATVGTGFDCTKCPTGHPQDCAIHPTSLPTEPAKPIESTVPDSVRAETVSSFSSKPPFSPTNATQLPTLTLPTPPLSKDEDTTEYSPTSTKCEPDADGETEMDVDSDTEWEELKREIDKELALENKENRDTPRKVADEIYYRLYNSYCSLTGEAPSDDVMSELQNAYITFIERQPAPFVPRNTPISETLTKITQPEPVVPQPTKAAQISRFAPIASSPFGANSLFSLPNSEPTAVYMVEEVSSAAEEQDGQLKGNMPVNKNADALADAVMVSEDPGMVPTAPASPVAEEDLDRTNHFQRIRKVGKDELIKSLRIEEHYAREDLANSPVSNTEHKIYAERLSETIERIEAMEETRVGEIELSKLLVSGLMNLLNILDAMAITPLPTNSPPLVARSPPPASAEEALKNTLINKKSTPIEPKELTHVETSIQVYNAHNFAQIPYCPSQPRYSVDPRTIPIAERPWFQGGANDFIRGTGQAKSLLMIDTRSLTIVENGEHVPAGFLKPFTELTGGLEPYIFPGRLAPLHSMPLNVPFSAATDYKQRVRELRRFRREVETLYQKTHRAFEASQIAELLRPHIALYKRVSKDAQQLSPIKVDRMYFFQRLHPIWNPFLKPVEAAFLRGAVYTLYGEFKTEHAAEIERLLRTPHHDDWEIRELVAMGALDNEFLEDEALAFFRDLDDEHWTFHAEEAFHNSIAAAEGTNGTMEGWENGPKIDSTCTEAIQVESIHNTTPVTAA